MSNPLREKVIREGSANKVSTIDYLFIIFRLFRKLVLTESHLLLTNSGKTRIFVEIPLSDVTGVSGATSGCLGFIPGYLLPTAVKVATARGKCFKFNVGLLGKKSEWVSAIKAQAGI